MSSCLSSQPHCHSRWRSLNKRFFFFFLSQRTNSKLLAFLHSTFIPGSLIWALPWSFLSSGCMESDPVSHQLLLHIRGEATHWYSFSTLGFFCYPSAGGSIALPADLFLQAWRPSAYVISGTINWLSVFILGLVFGYIVVRNPTAIYYLRLSRTGGRFYWFRSCIHLWSPPFLSRMALANSASWFLWLTPSPVVCFCCGLSRRPKEGQWWR